MSPPIAMSILQVFGANLRQLTVQRGPQSLVAEQLGIGRIQFQRYLRSESFPKPNVLQRICLFFGVDARILTEPLTPAQLRGIEAGRRVASAALLPDNGMQEAIAYACPDQDYFQPSRELPDGVYQRWRGAKARLDSAYVTLIQIKTLDRARVVRGYDFRGFYDGNTETTGRQREFRGALLKTQSGYVGLYFHSEPSRYVTMNFLSPFELNYQPAAVGFSCLARGALPDHARITRSLLIRVGDRWRAKMRAARQSGFVLWENVPKSVLPFIAPQDERF